MSIAIFTRRLSSFFLILMLFGASSSSFAQSNIIDTVGCDSLLLTPSVSGTSYTWSTSATTSTLRVYQSDTLWVEIDTGGGIVRDSFAVWIAPSAGAPIVSDTSVCVGESFSLSAISGTDNLVWYQDSVSEQTYVGTGNPIPYSIVDTTTFVVQGINYAGTFHTGLPTTGNTASGRYFGVSNERGIVFDVLQPVVMRKVTVYANNSFPATVQLRNGTDVFYSETLNLIQGANVITLDVFLQDDLGYRLALTPTMGGNLYIDLPFTFPIGNSFIQLRQGFPQISHYNFFYDWEVSPAGCSTPLSTIRVSVLPTPDFELGEDTVLCGMNSFSLDASFPGAGYLWSTGATTAMVTLGVSDSVWAEAYIGSCSFRDSIVVQLLVDPMPLVIGDTSICGPDFFTLLSDSSSDQVLWFEDSSITSPAYAIRDSLAIYITDTVTFFRESINLVQRISAGYKLPGNTGSGNFFSVSNERGLTFQTLDFLLLEEVTVHSNNSFSATIELRNSMGIVLRTTPYQFTAGANTVLLDYYLPPASKYFLMLTNLSNSASLYIDYPTSYPLTGPDLSVTGGVPLLSHYNFFYDIQVARIGCRSGLTPYQINLLPTPLIDLKSDTFLCGSGPLNLNAFYPGATYLWSTGDTTSQLTLTQKDTVDIRVSLGSCSVTNTIQANITPIPSAPLVADTSFCGPQAITVGVAPTGLLSVVWFDDSTGTDQSLHVGDSISLMLTQSRTVYAQKTTLKEGLTVGLDTIGATSGGGFFFISQDRGMIFDAYEDFVLGSVTVYSIGSFETSIQLTDGNGDLRAERTFRFWAGQNVVDLDFYVSVGSDYSLTLVDPGGKNIHLELPFSFPIGNDFLSIKRGFPNFSHYNYFYDWHIFPIGCISERSPLNINVSLPLNLPDTLYICEDTMLQANIMAATYSWNTGSTLPDITVDSMGRYMLTVTDGLGCTVIDTTRIGKPKPVKLGEDGVLCGKTLFSGYNIFNGKILWSTGDTTGNILLNVPGTYWAMIEEANGCMLSDTINVTGFENLPTINLGPDVSACEETTLNANNVGSHFLWNTGDTTQFVNATLTGTYWVQVTNTAGCTAGDTLNVNVTRKPSSLFTFQVNTTDPSKVNFFNLSSLGGSPSFISFEWFFGDGGRDSNINTNHTYLDSGIYTVLLIVTTNCGADTFEQTVAITLPVGIDLLLDPQDIVVFPNPTTGKLYFKFKKEITSPFLISLYDVHGRLCIQKAIARTSQGDLVWVVLDQQPEGLYFIRMTGGYMGSKSIMVIR